MKNILILVALCSSPALAQRVSTDLLSYLPPPSSWNKEVKEKNYTHYSIVNHRKYCEIYVFMGTNSKGDITADFESEWKNIIVSSYAVTAPPQITQTDTEAGWQARAGVGSFEWEEGVSVAMLTTISGYGRTTSIVAVTNTEDYTPVIQSVLASVQMNKVPAARPVAAPAPSSSGKAKPTALQGYMDYSPFTRTWTWKLRYPQPTKD
ncbi:MAG: hypothetical protein Q8L48_36900 [Archangium sp.]|nr:hypothetical protein [Archangium sp.]